MNMQFTSPSLNISSGDFGAWKQQCLSKKKFQGMSKKPVKIPLIAAIPKHIKAAPN